jgi:5-hmdU DNA kinase, helical domain
MDDSSLPATADRFFAFMAAREQLRLRKEAGEPWPWSDDEILNTYKFTNVKREHDRTTRWMRKNWTGPHENAPSGEIIFNCALFRYFGTAEFAAAVGWQTSYNPEYVIEIARRRHQNGLPVFTGAYIIPSLGQRKPKHEAVCRVILGAVWKDREQLAEIAATTRSWRAVAVGLSRLPGFGGTGFMAKEVLQDVIQTRVLAGATDRNTWCPAGPGARRGLNRIFTRPVRAQIAEARALREMLALFAAAPTRLPSFMPSLELHDIQFQLCEFDKYERVRCGEGRPKALYRRRSV